jgi:hypothetical protein
MRYSRLVPVAKVLCNRGLRGEYDATTVTGQGDPPGCPPLGLAPQAAAVGERSADRKRSSHRGDSPLAAQIASSGTNGTRNRE